MRTQTYKDRYTYRNGRIDSRAVLDAERKKETTGLWCTCRNRAPADKALLSVTGQLASVDGTYASAAIGLGAIRRLGNDSCHEKPQAVLRRKKKKGYHLLP